MLNSFYPILIAQDISNGSCIYTKHTEKLLPTKTCISKSQTHDKSDSGLV